MTLQARDRNGRAVNDLAITDLQLYEDGKPQEIATLSSVNLPIERRPSAAASPAVAVGETAWASNAATSEGRAFVLFVDAMHIAAERTVPARRLLTEFVTENMGDNDIAAVVVTGGLTGGQNFTGDKASLLAAINRFTGDALPSRMVSKWRHKIRLPYDYIRDDYASERAGRARQSLISLRRVVQMLTGLAGRRTSVLYVSEGLDIDMSDRLGNAAVPHTQMDAGRDSQDKWSNSILEANFAGMVADELQLTVEASTRSNVAIYAMDPRGLSDAGENTMEVAGMGVFGTGEGVDPFLPTSLFRAESLRMQQNLRDLAGRTGGRAIVNTNNFKGPLRAIIDDASQYYVLTYRMSHRDDGRFHRISVKTSRPGVTLSAREGYYSPRAGAATHSARSPLASLLESPIQLPGLTMSAASTVIPGAGKSIVRFAVEFGGKELGDTADAPVIELAYVLTDDEGKILSQGEKTLTLAVSSAMRNSLAEHGLRYVAELKAPAGRHHVRLAARNRGTQALGSLFWDVDVPVIPPSDVAVSPLVLTSQRTDTMPTISDVAPGTAAAGGLMTARRAFAAEDVLSISTLVANGRTDAEPLAAAFVVSTEDGREVARKDVTLPGADRRSELAAFSQRVGLETLPPGRYRADFVVRSANGRVRAERALVFEVSKGREPGA